MPYSARVLAAAGELGVPRIHFGVNTGSLLPLMAEAGADVVGVDWRTPLSSAIPLSATAPSRATSTRRWSSRRPR